MQILIDRSLALLSGENKAAAMTRWQSAELNNLAYKLVAMMFGDGTWSSVAGQVMQVSIYL